MPENPFMLPLLRSRSSMLTFTPRVDMPETRAFTDPSSSFAVTETPGGSDALLALFWHNIVGRFAKISAPAALDYSGGHKNTPGKYFIELPVYLLPWTLLVAAALRRAWDRVRVPGRAGTPW